MARTVDEGSSGERASVPGAGLSWGAVLSVAALTPVGAWIVYGHLPYEAVWLGVCGSVLLGLVKVAGEAARGASPPPSLPPNPVLDGLAVLGLLSAFFGPPLGWVLFETLLAGPASWPWVGQVRLGVVVVPPVLGVVGLLRWLPRSPSRVHAAGVMLVLLGLPLASTPWLIADLVGESGWRELTWDAARSLGTGPRHRTGGTITFVRSAEGAWLQVPGEVAATGTAEAFVLPAQGRVLGFR